MCFSSARPRSSGDNAAEAEADLTRAVVYPVTPKTPERKNQGTRSVYKRVTLIITMELG